MNQELIKTLQEECNKLYPKGYPLRSRGSGKVYLHLSHCLRWYAYQLYCNSYSCCSYKVTLEQAHSDIDNFVARSMSGID